MAIGALSTEGRPMAISSGTCGINISGMISCRIMAVLVSYPVAVDCYVMSTCANSHAFSSDFPMAHRPTAGLCKDSSLNFAVV